MTSRVLTATSVLLALALGVWLMPAARAELIGHWPLDEGSGDVAVDRSASGTDGQITNSATGGMGDGGTVWVNDPDRGNVISFNGSAEGAFVRVGDIPVMSMEQDFTWAFWGNQDPANADPNNVVFGNRYDTGTTDFTPRQFIKFTPTKFEWHMDGNGNDNLEYEDLSLTAGTWEHHAVVKSGATLTYYRDGQEANSKEITQFLEFPQPLFLGGIDAQAAGENWQGMMSDARIYDEALTAGDIESCFLGSCPGDGVPGDVNGDEVANLTDFEIISGNFGLSPATREEGDLRSPDEVGLEDFRAWKAAATGAIGVASQGAVPEPTGVSLACIGLAVAGWVAARRRR